MLSFESFYKEILENPVGELLEIKKKIVMETLKYSGVALVAIVINTLIYYYSKLEFLGWIYAVIAIGVIVIGYNFYKKRDKFISDYQELVAKKIIESMDANLTCSIADSLKKEDFFNSNIYKRMDITDFFGFLLVEGKYKNTEIRFSKIYTYYEEVKNYTERVDKGEYIEIRKGQKVKKVPLFKGFLFIADFNKEFKNKTILKSKELITKLRSKDKISFFKGNTIKMENIDFNSKFEVFSEDEVESRYILSLKLMEKILELHEKFKNGIQYKEKAGVIFDIINKMKKKFRKSIEISFVDSEIYIMIPNEDKFLEFSIVNQKKNEFETRKLYEAMKTMVEIVDVLDLNTRIWSKE